MKTRVLIIDDNCYKVFTAKQVLQSVLKIDVQTMDVESDRELCRRTDEFNPDMIIFNPDGGVVDLLSRMKKRNSNRRNTEVTLMLTAEFDAESIQRVRRFLAEFPKRAEMESKAA